MSIGKSRVVGLDPIDDAVEDYRASFREVRGVADFVVVNVSSPNTKDLRRMQGGAIARTLLSALARDNAARSEADGRRVPLLVKIAPDLSDTELEELLDVCEEVHVDGVVATNTTLARAGLATERAEIERIGTGGLSGPPLRARALEVVGRVRARLGPEVTVVGVGGIETADDAMALIRAGANLVQMYTGFIYEGPMVARTIARGLLQRVEESGAASINELVGLGDA
jgi:dihydroorotate dehydrogenase